jgi:hypothetical protein
MRRILLRGLLLFVGLILLVVGWVAGLRPLSMALDRLHTAVIDSRPLTRLGVADSNQGMLQVNELSLSTATLEYRPYPMEMKIDPAREFVVQTPGHAIVLGRLGDSFGIKPAVGDKARFQIEHSIMSWPTPLAMNFMTGYSPSWKRHVYYRLSWEKPDGARLEMVWRYEQWFYENWSSGFMTTPASTGLIRVDIRP